MVLKNLKLLHEKRDCAKYCGVPFVLSIRFFCFNYFVNFNPYDNDTCQD